MKNIHNLINKILSNKIIAKDKEHLKFLIKKEIDKNGLECSLNHIDVSRIKDFSKLFANPSIDALPPLYFDVYHKFNGDISQWDVSNAENMFGMFWESSFIGDISNWNVSKLNNMQAMFFGTTFNGDISRWDVSNVKNMKSVFAESEFDNNISNWNVSNVESMENIFCDAQFSGDVSQWKPYKLQKSKDAFKNTNAIAPYWSIFEGSLIVNSIDNYLLKNELSQQLKQNNVKDKKLKI